MCILFREELFRDDERVGMSNPNHERPKYQKAFTLFCE